MAAAVPEPVKASVVVGGLALLLKVSVALTVPLTTGLKVIENGMLWPAGIVAGSDSPPTLKTELLVFAAVTVTLVPVAVIVAEAVPLLPTTTLPRPRVLGVTESAPAVAVPVPDKGMDSDELDAFEPIVIVAPKVPTATGTNFALTVQVAPGASVPGTGQVPIFPQLNGPLDMELLVKLTVAPPVFVRVVINIALVLPTATLPKAILVGLADSVPIAVAFTVTEAVAYFVGSATLVALTVTVVFVVTVGALNKPELLTVPAVADQVTAVLLLFVTWAENCWLPPDATVAVVGETETVTAAAEVANVESSPVTRTPVESADRTR